MDNDAHYIARQSDKIRKNSVSNSPRWLQEVVKQKNPRLTLDLVDSVLLAYDDLDRKLFALTESINNLKKVVPYKTSNYPES